MAWLAMEHITNLTSGLFETGSCLNVQTGIELTVILLLQVPEDWNYKYVPLCLDVPQHQAAACSVHSQKSHKTLWYQ